MICRLQPSQPRAHERGKNAHAVRWREITPTLVAYNPEMRHKASAGPPLQWRLAVLLWLSIAEVQAAFGGAERKTAHVRPGWRQASPHD
jgi:hypothetical protein